MGGYYQHKTGLMEELHKKTANEQLNSLCLLLGIQLSLKTKVRHIVAWVVLLGILFLLM